MSFGQVLAIDIGGTRIKAGIVTERGELLRRESVLTPDRYDAFIETVRTLCSLVMTGVDGIDGVGIGCKGLIQPHTTVVEALPGPMRYLEGHPLSAAPLHLLPPGTRCVADNDARVALAGEVRWGAARGHRNAVLLTLGTGVGGGVVAEGAMLRGESGVAGHLGHLTLDPDGPTCVCGNQGCLEAFFSASALEAQAQASVRRGVETKLAALHEITCEHIFRLAREGDGEARRLVDRGVGYLAAGIQSLLLVFDPEIVILTGQIIEAGDYLLEPLRAQVRARSWRLIRREVPIVRSALEDPSGLLGCAALVWA